MPKVQYDKEMIIGNILELGEAQGFQEITVRNIAKKIGCSVAPIYTVFKNAQEAITAAKLEAMKQVIEETEKKFTDHVFLNIGVGLLVYARDHKMLYKELFMTNTDEKVIHMLHEKSLEKMGQNGLSDMFTKDELKELHTKMWIFTQGMALMLTSNQLKDTSTEFFIQSQGELGSQIMTAMLFEKGSLKHYIKEGEKHGFGNPRWDIW